MSDRYTNMISSMYGYKRNNHYSGLCEGMEVIVYDNNGNPVMQDLVEEITTEAIKVGGQWWWDFDYSVRPID